MLAFWIALVRFGASPPPAVVVILALATLAAAALLERALAQVEDNARPRQVRTRSRIRLMISPVGRSPPARRSRAGLERPVAGLRACFVVRINGSLADLR
jgi:hypothetical protein